MSKNTSTSNASNMDFPALGSSSLTCKVCNKSYSTRDHLTRHLKTHEAPKLSCIMCEKLFVRRDLLNKHMKTHIPTPVKTNAIDVSTPLINVPPMNTPTSMMNNSTPISDASTSLPNTSLQMEPSTPITNPVISGPSSELNNSQHGITSSMEIAQPVINKQSVLLPSPHDIPSQPSLQTQSLHACEVCGKVFGQKKRLNQHLKTHGDPQHACQVCPKRFITQSDLVRHMNTTHDPKKSSFVCKTCSREFTTRQHLREHCDSEHRAAPAPKPKRAKPGKMSDVLTICTFHPSSDSEKDLMLSLEEVRPQIVHNILGQLQMKKAVKWYVVAHARITRETPDGVVHVNTPFFRSRVVTQLDESNLEDKIDGAYNKVRKSFETYIKGGSDWVLDVVLSIDLKMANYRPLAPRSYFKLPQRLAAKKALINIQNEDNKCFTWSVLAALHSTQNHPERVSHYTPYEAEIKLGNVEYPIAPSKVSTIEELNNLRINVFGYDEQEVFPIYISNRVEEEVINLLLIVDGDRQHYCLIKNFSRLLGDLTHHKAEAHYCYRCLHRFSSKRILTDHLPYCGEHAPQRIQMPSGEKAKLSFNNEKAMQKLPFIIYADFETLVCKLDTTDDKTCKTATYTPCGYAYVVIDSEGVYKPPVVYRGPNTVDHFIKQMLEVKEQLEPEFHKNVTMKLTEADNIKIREATHCGICKKPLENDRVLDHHHQNGQFRQVLHNRCNLNFQVDKVLPVVFHNLKNFDMHLIMQGLGKVKDHNISVIPNTMEKYICMSLTKKVTEERKKPVVMRFIDSLAFLNASLSRLVDNLDNNKFKILKSCHDNQHVDLLLRKGVYPYEYFNSFARFDETCLPPMEAFYSSLTDENVSAEDYLHAQNVWEKFNIRNLGEYHDLYVKSDVLLLADVFENFRDLTMEFYELDAAHMVTSPGLAWHAALKKTDIVLDLFTDIDMHLFIEKGTRGGVSMISHRYAKANIPGSLEYNPEEENRHILYLDANNLYGWAMSQHLPVGNFRWIENPELVKLEDIMEIPDDADEGLILEAGLEVMVWIHGGFLQWGSGHEPGMCPSGRVAKRLNAVFVSFNYRLGALGFMALDVLSQNPMDARGNYGLWDQIVALQWVRHNIRAFGGDPEKVTVFGGDSGAASILALQASEAAKGLFRAAWLMGPALTFNRTFEDLSQHNRVFFLARTGCSNATCLRRLSAKQVVESHLGKDEPSFRIRDQNDLPITGIYPEQLIVLDGELLHRPPLEAIETGDGAVPMLVGTTAQAIEAWPGPDDLYKWDWKQLSKYVVTSLDSFGKGIGQEALDIYNASKHNDFVSAEEVYSSMVTDLRQTCPIHQMCQALVNGSSTSAPLYRYVVTATPSVPIKTLGYPSSYAFHLWDAIAFFDHMEHYMESPTPSDYIFRDELHRMVRAFVRSGGTRAPIPGWGPFPENLALVTRDNVSIIQNYHEDKCRFWKEKGFEDYAWVS